ncbi:hypothetical protein LOAG_13457 [Loa loa]|uniref:Uncharacterized protein n=1 Tax=Loa loa TaxID=7209 RepID=A0A1S0TJZ3_LOALO|nr:hypothetical protein LOAG_13457 [Loa loa]EFO15059.1 hypothetical protein LOAG_13457 [Loa loa]
MSLISTPFSDLSISLGTPYRLGHPENKQQSRRMYPNFTTVYMKKSDMLIIFTHCYYLKMRKDKKFSDKIFYSKQKLSNTTLHVRKKGQEFMIELVRQTDADIKGEFRVQFRAQSTNSKKYAAICHSTV